MQPKGTDGRDDAASVDGEELQMFRELAEEDPAEGAEHAPAPGSIFPRARPKGMRIIAVSGAKGGVGKSLVATNLAIYLATIGRKVVVVDADADGANLHTFLGVDRPGFLATYVPPLPSFHLVADGSAPPPLADPSRPTAVTRKIPPLGLGRLRPSSPREEKKPRSPDDPIETSIPGLSLLHAGLDEPPKGTSRRRTRSALMTHLRALDAEYAVVDLGSGVTPSLVDFWLGADLSLFVSLPEPTAIENTYRFLRCAFARFIRARVEAPGPRARLIHKLRELGNAPAPLDLATALESERDELAATVRAEMEDGFRFRMVFNQTRLRADLELGDRMRSAALRRLGVHLEYLGYIDSDDTVWSCVRARRPLLVESPGTKASKSIEKIARRLIALDAGKGRRRPLRTAPPDTHHDLLEVERGATDEEIRRAYKRAKEVYAADSLVRYGLFDDAGLEALRARLNEAYDVLLDPARRRPYEMSVFPEEPEPVRPSDFPGELRPKPPAPLITPETDFNGTLIRAVRESQGLDVPSISQRTKISTLYLDAIEADDYAALPALVYVRGFVTEVAKCLRLDPEQVSRTYIQRYRRYLEDRERL
jgi:flagellar biosynthesis protein FlhG